MTKEAGGNGLVERRKPECYFSHNFPYDFRHRKQSTSGLKHKIFHCVTKTEENCS